MSSVLFYFNCLVAMVAIIYAYYSVRTQTALMFPTQAAAAEAIAKIIENENCQSNVDGPLVVDLGSGAGGLCFKLSKKLPKATIIGVEIAWPVWLVAKIRQLIRGNRNVQFKNDDLWHYNISKADVIITYLASHLMAQIDAKLSAEAKEGALVISNTFPLPKNREPIVRIPIEASVSKELWVYRI